MSGEKDADSGVIKIDSTGFGEGSAMEEVSIMAKLPLGMSVLGEGLMER